MIHTKYSSLTTDEFLRVLRDKQGKSPVIDECIRRLEEPPEDEEDGCSVCEAIKPSQCVVCEAEL